MRKFRIVAVPLTIFVALSALVLSSEGRSETVTEVGSPQRAENSVAQELAQPWPTPDPASMILPDELQAYDNFGTALAYDGNILAVGAPNTDLEGTRNVGAVFLFQKRGNTWQQIARLTPDPLQADSRFGSALAIDGEILAVGAPYEFNPGAGNASGAVYIFTRSRNEWALEKRLAAQDGAPFDLFGGTLALQGADLAVGGRAADGPNGERDAGAVYLYRRDNRDWILQARLGTDAAPFDHFGHALAFGGEELLIGVPDADPSQTSNAGQVYVYRQNRGSWEEHSRLTAHDIREHARFGAELYVHDDLLAILAPQEYQETGPMPAYAYAYEAKFGTVHIFERRAKQWHWQARLVPEPVDNEHAVQVNSAVITTRGDRPRLALSGYGRAGFFSFELQGRAWQALPQHNLPHFVLIEGQALAAAGDQILLGSRFYDIQRPSGAALQAAGVIWILDW